jgi:predicted nucleic acid-binding protein
MTVLVDTNLLVRSLQQGSPHYAAASTAIAVSLRRNDQLCIVPQVLYELWSVCTRPPGENGLGLTLKKAHAEQLHALSVFKLLPDNATILPEWQRLVVQHDVKGRNAHDARLVAAMNVHGVSQILTFNGTDFTRYPGIAVLDPRSFVPPTPAPE